MICTWTWLHLTRCEHLREPKTTGDDGERDGRGGEEVQLESRVRERQFLAFFSGGRERALLSFFFYSSLLLKRNLRLRIGFFFCFLL